MTSIQGNLTSIGICVLLLSFTYAAPQARSSGAKKGSVARDGQHDFDFEIGTWKTDIKRLPHPLTGSKDWIECHGTTVVHRVWNGRANLAELAADCPTGHFDALSLRLYNPESYQWTLNFANASSGTLGQPTVGEFKGGRGEFYDQELFSGRAILVRFVITPVSADVCRFEQSFSGDGGKSWELNWVATDTRVRGPTSTTHDDQGGERRGRPPGVRNDEW